MRRIASLTVVACVLMVLGGVALATPNSPSPPAQPRPQQIGTVEPVDAALGYLAADRSVTFHYPGAEYVKVHLGQVRLLPGDYVTVADPQREEVHRYEPESAGGWAMSVTGDTAVVTLHVTDPVGVRGALGRLGVRVDRVARGLAAGEAPAAAGREETVCGRSDSQDAVCYQSSHPGIYRSSLPVARLLIDGMQMCTAFRVGPSNRLLTNHHCIADAQQARATEVWFGYQCLECGGWQVQRPVKVRADRVLAADRTLDFTLFTVDDFEKVKQFGQLELEPRPLRAGEEIYIPQHPGGGPGQVAVRSDWDRSGNCAVANPQVHGYDWYTDVAYFCDTDGGSSGSPVISRETHRVVALHHFGGCPNSGVRMDLIYPEVAAHLSPSRRS